MSLRIWLPLTNNLRNQGASSLTSVAIPSCATIDNTGKIGKCYTSSGAANGIATMLDFTASEFSIAAWVRINTRVNAWRCPFKLANSSAAANYSYIGFCCEHNTQASYVGFHFYKTIDGTNTAIFDAYPITNMTVGVWTHLAVAYDGKTVTYYKDGVQVSSATIATAKQNTVANMDRIIMLGGNGERGAAAVKSSLNDVRIYDHCLSPEEVRELANGLVLHYKLDGFKNGYGAPNLLKNSQTLGTGFGGSGTTIQNAFGKFAAKYKDNTSGTGYSDTLTYSNAVTVNPSEIYTASFWAKADTEHSIICYFYNNTSGIVQATHRSASNGLNGTPSGDGATILTITTEWQYYWITWTFGASGTAAAKTLLLGRQSAGNSGVYIAAPKLEKNDAPTAWAPAATDAGAEFDTIIDNSGYGHDGIITGTLLHNSDAGKYNSSFYITNGQTNYITTIDEIGNFSSGITINTWFKTNCKSPPGRYHAILTDLTTDYHDTIFLISIHDSGFFHGGIKINNSLTISSTHHTTLCNGEWHMVTLTYDGTVMKRYVDGIHAEEADQALTGTISAAFSQFKIGNSTAFGEAAKELYINDMRIYVTPLFDSEIKKLYNIGMGMDNKNQIHTYEFNELVPPSLSKTGILGGLLNEVDECSYISLQNDTNWLVNGAIER